MARAKKDGAYLGGRPHHHFTKIIDDHDMLLIEHARQETFNEIKGKGPGL